MKILYINHRKQQCGVYEFGREIGRLLETSAKFSFIYSELDSFEELKAAYKTHEPDIIIYNHHPQTMPWLNNKPAEQLRFRGLRCIHIGTIHEVDQKIADSKTNIQFDFYIAPDATLFLKNQFVFKTNRLLPVKPVETVANDKRDVPVIGSFGFATPGKRFDKIIELVQNEFDEAEIKLNIPFAKFGDESGELARSVAAECKSKLTKSGIKLHINHDYLNKAELVQFLSGNTINVFLYESENGRGISSATDWAIASGRPLAVSNSNLFRNLFQCYPGIISGESTLKEIISNGTKPLTNVIVECSAENVLWEYETIIEAVIQRFQKRPVIIPFLIAKAKKYTKRILGIKTATHTQNNIWTKAEDEFTYVRKREKVPYEVVAGGESLNRILDNSARVMYAPAIRFLEIHFPELIAKKIPEANIQQAFVFDTAVRLSASLHNPKMLAAGAFEDTAAEALKLAGYNIDFIDPVINYDLGTFIKKPSVKGGTYDIIISTSVIEHVKEDEQFVMDISYLLKSGGFAIITCDFHPDYKPGDDIPDVDERWYNKKDLSERLLSVIPECELVDSPNWECEKPDFIYLNKYNYTFASFVVKKK